MTPCDSGVVWTTRDTAILMVGPVGSSWSSGTATNPHSAPADTSAEASHGPHTTGAGTNPGGGCGAGDACASGAASTPAASSPAVSTAVTDLRTFPPISSPAVTARLRAPRR